MKYIKLAIGSIIILSLILFTFSYSNKKDVKANLNIEKQELRAVWITPITGDVSTYKNEASYKLEITGILDMLESYNMNAVIYHVRTHNDALYPSEYNPVSKYMAQANFNEFDPLEWVIKETKSRGMEFHAWLNPYRVGNSYVGTMPSSNPASNPNNVLKNPSNNALTILNPGLPIVREFINNTVKEIIENYDVDAIHFDDYFYTNLGTNGNDIINEPDQDTFLQYQGNYSNTNLGKADWRREQINIMVESVSNTIKDHNDTNNKYVQFGISPTGIYKNGNGVVTYDSNGMPVTTGSSTRGQQHYSSYLFSDSLHWVKSGYLDYILPQSYWATNHSVAAYNNVMGWWNKVLKNLDVNLYSGIGLYIAIESSNTFNWKTDPLEMKKQLDMIDTFENVQGSSVFTLNHITKAYKNQNTVLKNLLDNAYNAKWQDIAVLPELRSFDKINLGSVNNFNNSDGKLTWDQLDDAKNYYIYKSSTTINYSSEEIIGVVGGTITEFDIGEAEGFTYSIKALSHSNTLGLGPNFETKINTLEETSIRKETITQLQALTFNAQVSLDVNYNDLGFYLVYGDLSLSELINKVGNDNIIINGKKVFKHSAVNVNADGTYSVNLTNIPESGYVRDISAVAYYRVGTKTFLASNVVKTSVARTAINNNDLYIIEYLKDNIKKQGLNSYGQLEVTDGIYENNAKVIADEFINDWNNKFGSNLDKTNHQEFHSSARIGLFGAADANMNLSNSNIYKFFNDQEYKDKWMFLLDYLRSVDGTTHTTRQIDAIKGNGTNADYPLYLANHLSYSIINFFTGTHVVGGYTSINFTTTSLYDTLIAYNNQIIINLNNYKLFNITDEI